MQITKTLTVEDLIKIRESVKQDKAKWIKERLPISEFLYSPPVVSDFDYISDAVGYIATLEAQIDLNFKALENMDCGDKETDSEFFRLCYINKNLTRYVISLLAELQVEVTTLTEERKDENWTLTTA